MTRLFISYAHDDRRLLGAFLKHLGAMAKALTGDGPASVWFDDHLRGGQDWDARIAAELDRADVFLLFVTPTFLASAYIQEKELPAILAAREARAALVVPVLARKTHWEDQLGHLHAVPRDARNRLKPIDGWRPTNDGHFAAVEQIRDAIVEHRRSRAKDGPDRRSAVVPQDFSDRTAVESWLRTRNRAEIVAFAARAALRAMPLAIEDLNVTRMPRRKQLGTTAVLSILRATAVPWISARYSVKGAALSGAAATASVVVYPADAGVVYARSVYVAASAASTAAAGGDTAYDASNAADATNAAYAAANAADAAYAAYSAATAARADALWLGGAEPGADLTDQPLWLAAAPAWARDHWATLNALLLAQDEDWDVWTSWYEDRLSGRPVDDWLELQRALIPDALWRRGPKVVNAEIKRLMAARQRQLAAAAPADGVVELQRFAATAEGAIAAETEGPLPSLPAAGSARDHRQRLRDCRQAGEDLLRAINNRRFNVRPDYAEAMAALLKALPKRIGDGNIYSADREARFLLRMMVQDGASLPGAFALKLQGVLEAHLGLRAYYPEVEAFYHAVRSGRLVLPFPLDAYARVEATAAKHTPTLFAPSVGRVLAGDRISAAADSATTTSAEDAAPPAAGAAAQPPPLRDPLGPLDPVASEGYRRASIANSLWRVFLKGDGVARSTEGWIKAADALEPAVKRILDWLGQFGGGP